VRVDSKQAILDGILIVSFTLTILSIASLLYDDTTIPTDIINKLC